MSATSGRRAGQDADPFADFRAGGTGTQTDERPPVRAVTRADARPYTQTGPVADPGEPYRPEPEQRPMTRREAREAQARSEALSRDTGSAGRSIGTVNPGSAESRDTGTAGATVTALPRRIGAPDPGLRVVRDRTDTAGQVGAPPPAGTGPVVPVASPPSWFGEYRTAEPAAPREIPARAPLPTAEPPQNHTGYARNGYSADQATGYAPGYPAPDHVGHYGQPTYYPDQAPYADPQYADPQYADPQYADPQYADPQYADPQYADPDYEDHYDDGYAGDLSRAERKAVEREGKRRKARGPRTVLVLIAILSAVGVGCYFAWSGLQPTIQKVRDQFAPPADFAGPGTGQVTVTIAERETAAPIGQKLFDAGVVASVAAFVDAAKANPDWVKVQPGDYTLQQQLPAAAAVAALLDSTNVVRNNITIPEGLRTVDIFASLASQTSELAAAGTLPAAISVEEFTAAALALELPPEAALNLPAEQRPPNTVGDTEGWLFPDTYSVGASPTAQTIVQTMLDATQSKLTAAGVPREQWHQVLTKASLVQAEARIPEDFGKVARVTENRLEFGVPTANGQGTVKRIQYDSTTNYAVGKARGVPDANELASTSPYNTRAIDGLPPGPINNPGLDAIQAVLNPTPGDWLFFTTVNLCTGETFFEVTADEAKADAAQFKAWAKENQNGDGTYNCG